jgi:hypothetical protein
VKRLRLALSRRAGRALLQQVHYFAAKSVFHPAADLARRNPACSIREAGRHEQSEFKTGIDCRGLRRGVARRNAVCYQVAPQVRIVAGYDLMYWTGVQRSGGLIDTTLNPNLIPPPLAGGPQRPQPVFNTQPLLAQGFNFGVRYDY